MANLNVTGSATGNCRNKTALGPGKSLMDWVRLCNSGKDLAGNGRIIKSVSPEELASHNKTSDAWIAIRGIVYNVTDYMSFHPGGVDELMRGTGMDATKLFNKVHPWVNYESMLKKCIVGRLVHINSSPISSTSGISENKIDCDHCNSHTKIDGRPNNIFRSDWFQQTSFLTFCFFFKFNNTSTALPVSVMLRDNRRLTIQIKTEIYVYELEGNIRWPCSIKILQSVAEVKLQKALAKQWSTFGQKLTNTDDFIPQFCQMKIIHKTDLTYNVKLIGVQYKENIIHHIPVGQHVKLKCIIDGEEITRSYTPVSLLTQCPTVYPEPTLFFIIKEYQHGKLSRELCRLRTNDLIEMSFPIGTFNCSIVKKMSNLLLIAAGTGLTPMTSLIIWSLNSTRVNVKLIYCNKTEEDIIWKEEINRLTISNSRFSVHHILSQPLDSWCGEKGLITKNSILKHIDNFTEDHYTCICGPSEFNQLCIKTLQEAGCLEHNYFTFGE